MKLFLIGRIPARAVLGITALLVLILRTTSAQAPAEQTAAPTTTIKVSTRLVTIDVVVQDKKNQPVPGLTKDDFELFEDDQPQTLSVFSVEGQAPSGFRLALPAALPLGTFSNRLNVQSNVPVSATVILLDGLNTSVSDLAMARGQLAKFLQNLQPQDRVAMYSMGKGLRVVQDFTSDSALLLEALKGLHPEPHGGGGPQLSSIMTPDPRLDPGSGDAKLAALMSVPTVDTTLRTLEVIGQHLASLPGRKTLIWISRGFPLIVISGPRDDPFADRTDMTPRVRKASQVLSKYNVALYPMDTRALQVGINNIDKGAMLDSAPYTPVVSMARGENNKAMQDAHDSGRLLAQLTGGRTYYGQNDLAYGMRSAVDDSKLVYVLGYYPAEDKWDSQFHTFKVRVKQPGVKLTYRSGYLATPEPQPLVPENSQAVLEKAALAPLDSSAIGLFARVQKEGVNGQNLTIDLLVDVNDLMLDHNGDRWKGDLEVVIAQLTSSGALVENAGRKHSVQLNLKENYYALLRSTGLQLFFPFDRDPKAVQVRVVVRSAVSGTVGSVSIPLDKTAGE